MTPIPNIVILYQRVESSLKDYQREVESNSTTIGFVTDVVLLYPSGRTTWNISATAETCINMVPTHFAIGI
jgi:hypothetical protein